MIRSVCTAMLLILALSASALSELSRTPAASVLWNRYSAVRVVDGYAVALGPDGVAVCEYDRTAGEFVHVSHLFLDDTPVALRIFDQTLVVRTERDSLVMIDMSDRPQLERLNAVKPGSTYADFAWHDGSLYLAMWFDGIQRWTFSAGQGHMADSSMKGVLVTQIEVSGSTLYALDQYNGVMRYDISGSGFGAFQGYLYVPFRAGAFALDGSDIVLGGLNEGLYTGRFGFTGSGVIDSVSEARASERIFVGAGLYAGLADREINVVDGTSLSVVASVTIDDNPPDGDLFTIADTAFLVVPGETGGLVVYDLLGSGPAQPRYHRPGPISALAFAADRLVTGGVRNPLDIFEIDDSMSPVLARTLEPARQAVRATVTNGDTVMAVYGELDELAVLYRADPTDEEYVRQSVPVDADQVIGLQHLPSWPGSDFGALAVVSGSSIAVYRFDSTALDTDPLVWYFGDDLNAAILTPDMLWVSTFKRTLKAYSISGSGQLQHLSQLAIGVPVTQLLRRGARVFYFEGALLRSVDYSSPLQPVASAFPLMLPVRAAALQGDTLVTIGNEGVAAYRMRYSQPELLQIGGRRGTLIALNDTLVATSDGSSVHLYSLGAGTPTDVDDDPLVPSAFALSQNYPNPFNPVTTIRFSLPRSAHAELTVFNILGQRVRLLVDSPLRAGTHTVEWDSHDDRGRAVASGVYFYRLKADGRSLSRKMMLIK